MESPTPQIPSRKDWHNPIVSLLEEDSKMMPTMLCLFYHLRDCRMSISSCTAATADHQLMPVIMVWTQEKKLMLLLWVHITQHVSNQTDTLALVRSVYKPLRIPLKRLSCQQADDLLITLRERLKKNLLKRDGRDLQLVRLSSERSYS